MKKVVIFYSDSDGLQPLDNYLHPGIWLIGNKSIVDERSQNNISLIEWIVRHLNFQGVKEFTIVGGQRVLQLTSITKLLMKQLGVDITIIPHTLSHMAERLMLLPDEDFVLYPGTVLTNADIRPLLTELNGGAMEILVSRGVKYRVGIATIDPTTNLITEFKEKPYDKSLSSNTGIVALKGGWKDILSDYLAKNKSSSSDNIFNEFLHDSAHKSLVKVQLMKSINQQDPWWINFDNLETWIKLDIDLIINRMDHLSEQ